MPVDFKENASQSPTLNYREKPRKTAISLCLVGILAGGVLGEFLREEMVAASRQHQVFSALLNTSEVRTALAAKSSGDSPSANEMIQIDGPWARDLCWQDREGRLRDSCVQRAEALPGIFEDDLGLCAQEQS